MRQIKPEDGIKIMHAEPIAGLWHTPRNFRLSYGIKFEYFEDDSFEDYLCALIELEDGQLVYFQRTLTASGVDIHLAGDMDVKSDTLAALISELKIGKKEFTWINESIHIPVLQKAWDGLTK